MAGLLTSRRAVWFLNVLVKYESIKFVDEKPVNVMLKPSLAPGVVSAIVSRKLYQ
eukprot:EC787045.1.p5 GENE.EC787045.1~~EC787045.1.p5  ORF type:complete len:55 (-),score=3.99 EC787045.1:104-268(-)